MSAERVFLVVLVSSLLGFGGFGSLPMLQRFLSQAGLAADTLILQALTIGRLSPGPNGTFLLAIGYLIAGPWGALAAALAVLIPPLAILPIARLRSRFEHLPRFRAILRSLGLAVVALLMATTASLVEQATTSLVTGVILGSAALLLLLRVPPVLVLVGAGATGYWALA